MGLSDRGLAFLALGLLAAARATGAPPEDSAAAAGLDHGRWNRLVKANVTQGGWVDYRVIRERWAGELQSYLRQLAGADLRSIKNSSELKAFWINAYNAICVRKLIDHKLPATVPHAAFFGKNIFKERTYEVAGKLRSLDDIEHGILRKRFRDNRIHAALVCGASSCPRLRPEAYSGKHLDRQLDEECRRWVREGRTKDGKRKNYLDRKSGTFHVSKIFHWYREDFGDSAEGVLKFIGRFASESDRRFLRSERVRVEYLDYDWTLNKKG